MLSFHVFNVIPTGFFNNLASGSNQRIYSDCIQLIYKEYEREISYRIPRNRIRDTLAIYFLENHVELSYDEYSGDRTANDSKAGCRSESELYAKQQAYDKNWSLCNTLAERNQSIRKECEEIIREYRVVVDTMESTTRPVVASEFNLVERQAEQKAKTSLQKMYGKDFSEYGLREASLKAQIELKKPDKDRTYERGVRIR